MTSLLVERKVYSRLLAIVLPNNLYQDSTLAVCDFQFIVLHFFPLLLIFFSSIPCLNTEIVLDIMKLFFLSSCSLQGSMYNHNELKVPMNAIKNEYISSRYQDETFLLSPDLSSIFSVRTYEILCLLSFIVPKSIQHDY